MSIACSYRQAEEAATTALFHDPKLLKARYRRGLARKGQNHLKAAIPGSYSSALLATLIVIATDFETVLQHDPTCVEAEKELEYVRELWECGEGSDDGAGTSDDDWPHYEDDGNSVAAQSDSSDCRHVGNGTACRFYNHGGCFRGENCAFSHAPDKKSVRDKLCVILLL